jgi:spermidine synthase
MKVLSRRHEAGRSVRVVEYRFDGSRLYFDGPALYTHVDAHGGNLLAYISAMARTLAGAPTVLLLGTAGGALATQLSRAGVAVTAVDDWLTAFELARRWFHLPDDVECIHADALTLLRETDRQWAAVAIDVFHGVEIPDEFLTEDVGHLLKKVVEPGGLIVWNVADSPGSWPARWIVRALRLQGLQPSMVSVIDVDVGNTLVVCRNSPAELGDSAGPIAVGTTRFLPGQAR